VTPGGSLSAGARIHPDWTFSVDGREHSLTYRSVAGRLLLDGHAVPFEQDQYYRFPYGTITDSTFAIGRHACILRCRQSRWNGIIEYVLVVDGSARPLERTATNRTDVLVVLLVLIGVVGWAAAVVPGWWAKYGAIVP